STNRAQRRVLEVTVPSWPTRGRGATAARGRSLLEPSVRARAASREEARELGGVARHSLELLAAVAAAQRDGHLALVTVHDAPVCARGLPALEPRDDLRAVHACEYPPPLRRAPGAGPLERGSPA